MNSKVLELIEVNSDTDLHSNNKTFISRKSHISNLSNQIEIEKKRINSQIIKRKYIYLFILALMYLIPMFLDSYNSAKQNISYKTGSSVAVFFCIIRYSVCSRLILRDKIYHHQILSIIIIIFCTVIIFILTFIGKGNTLDLSVASNLGLMAIIYVFYSLYNVLEKRYFNKYMDSPYHLMFIVGLISTVVILLYETITVLAYSNKESFNGIFLQLEINFKKSNIYFLILLGDILSAFIWVMGIHLTVYFLTPCHFILSEGVAQIVSTFINDTLGGDIHPAIQVIIYILFLIIIFASLVYNEVIILNFFSLSKNTKKFIETRAKTETEIMLDKNHESKLPQPLIEDESNL